MPYILDTHTLIWLLNEPEKLSSVAKDIIRDGNNECLVFIVSLWEIAIKTNLKKLDLKISLEDIQLKIEENNIKILSLHYHHLIAYISLPLIHKDPFDRILVAQGNMHQSTIITKDPVIQQYAVSTIW